MELKPCHRRPLRPDEIGPRVMELSKYLRKNFNAAVAEQGLFSGQQDILLLLIRQPGMTLGQLSRALRVDEKDARIVRLYPTSVAEDAPKKIHQKMNAMEQVLTAGMSQEQVLTLAGLLERALQNVGKENP